MWNALKQQVSFSVIYKLNLFIYLLMIIVISLHLYRGYCYTGRVEDPKICIFLLLVLFYPSYYCLLGFRDYLCKRWPGAYISTKFLLL